MPFFYVTINIKIPFFLEFWLLFSWVAPYYSSLPRTVLIIQLQEEIAETSTVIEYLRAGNITIDKYKFQTNEAYSIGFQSRLGREIPLVLMGFDASNYIYLMINPSIKSLYRI